MDQGPYTNYPRGQYMQTGGTPPRNEINFDAISRGWNLVSANLGTMVGVGALSIIGPGILSFIIRLPISFLQISQESSRSSDSAASLGLIAVLLLVGAVLQACVNGIVMGCMSNFMLRAVRTGRADINDYFGGFRFAGKCIVATLIYSIAVTAGVVALIIGAFVVLALGMFTFLEIVDRDCGPVEALTASFTRLWPHVVMAVVFGFVIYLLCGVGYMACCVGLFVSYPLMFAALTYAYTDLTGTGPSVPVGPAVTPNAYVPPAETPHPEPPQNPVPPPPPPPPPPVG